jgi:hypothetical protein
MQKDAYKISIDCGGESPLGIELVATNSRIFSPRRNGGN